MPNKNINTEDISKINALDGKFIHVKVGTENNPAESEDIEEIEKKITDIVKDNNIKCLVLVTHHAVNITII